MSPTRLPAQWELESSSFCPPLYTKYLAYTQQVHDEQLSK